MPRRGANPGSVGPRRALIAVRIAAPLTLGLAAVLALTGCATARDQVVLDVPPAHRADAPLFIELRVGAIGPGHELTVTTTEGRPLGVVSPHGLRLGAEAGLYVLPIPAEVARDGRVRVRLALTRSDGPSRAPTDEEVRSIRLVDDAP